MKLCIFTNHFFPEDFKVNDIAFELAKRGYEITVITAVPDYPKGVFFEGYGIFKRSREIVNGVSVIRLPIIPRGNGRVRRLVWNYGSYYVSARFFTFFHSLFHRYDAIFVHLTSPFFISKCALHMKRIQKIPLYFWALDLWPESITAATGLSWKPIINPQVRFAKRVYDKCDKILIGSKGFAQSILEKGDYKDKLEYFPNWAESSEVVMNEEWSCIEPFASLTSYDFVILFAGNLGESQNLEIAVRTVSELKSSNIKMIFLGDGRARKNLISLANELGILNSKVFFPGRFPLESMPYFMQKADMLFVSLRDSLIFNLTVPAKVQFYMAQGKPILAMLNGDGAELIQESQCGFVGPAGDSHALRKNIITALGLPKAKLRQMGLNGSLYYSENFTKEQRINQLIEILES